MHMARGVGIVGVVALLFVGSAVARAEAPDLSGTYTVEGMSPGAKAPYRGTLTIKKTAKTYQVNWSIGKAVYFGTGVVQGDYFAVSYTSKSGTYFGVLLYHIKEGGKKMSGIWTLAGANQLGTETLVKQNK